MIDGLLYVLGIALMAMMVTALFAGAIGALIEWWKGDDSAD